MFEIYKDDLFLDYNNVSLIKIGGKTFFYIYKRMLENLEDLLIIDNDFKEYIDLIIEGLSKNSDYTSKKHL